LSRYETPKININVGAAKMIAVGIIALISFTKKVKNRQIASHLLFLLPRDARYVQELPPWRIWWPYLT